ncbi:hypothetical protein BC940DRAFT_307703 [Gongronella butleri]|nr:hypothetical protein BC940DRAFT_307703 [Gongronella butleri]
MLRRVPRLVSLRRRIHTTTMDPELRLSPDEQQLAQFTLPTFKVGDYVHAFRHGEFSGVVTTAAMSAGRQQRLTLLQRNGREKVCRSSDVAFHVPLFLESAHVHPRDKPNALETTTLARIIDTYQRSVKLTRGAAILRLDQLYDKSHDQNNVSSLAALTDLAFAASPKDPAQRLLQEHATFTYLVANNVHFLPFGHPLACQWVPRPRNDVQAVEFVVDAVRTKNKAFTGFVARAAQRIKYVQHHMDPVLGTLTASQSDMIRQKMPWEEPSDTQFLAFLLNWVRQPRVITSSPHQVVGPAILKACAAYRDALFIDRTLAAQCLKDLGVFRSYDNLALFDDAPVLEPFVWSEQADSHREWMAAHHQHHASLSSEEIGNDDKKWRKTTECYEKDPCDALRHDVGTLNVYTIDDPTAKEIDDGISIETDSSGAQWVHVHVADPTAYLPPSHALTTSMANRVQTMYLPETHFPLLPGPMAKKISLGQKGPQYALTFSAIVTADGALEQCTVRPSIVRNVVKLAYDDVDAHALFNEKKQLAKAQWPPILPFDEPIAHPSASTLPKSNDKGQAATAHAKDMVALHDLVQRHAERRVLDGAIHVTRPDASVHLSPTPLPLPIPAIDASSACHHYVTELPAISVSLSASAVSPARTMVAEAMIMAGRIASTYARDHGIVLPFRTQQWPEESLATRDTLLASRNSSGFVPFGELLAHMHDLPPAATTTAFAQPHALMGITDGYAKVTSPLRRYMDMLIHWQLKAHLLRDKLPFAESALKTLAPRFELKEKLMAMAQQRAQDHWVVQLLHRLNDRDARQWHAIVHHPARPVRTPLGAVIHAADATLIELGIRVRIDNIADAVHTGDVLPVRIASVHTQTARVNVVPR